MTISRRTLLTAARIRAARFAPAAPGLRRLSGQADPADRAVRGRRQCRSRGAHRRRGHVAVARPADRGRGPRRRGRQHRRGRGRDRRARRLHAADRLERPAHRQSVRAGEAALRSAEGLRADRACQSRSAFDRAQQFGAGENARRTHRAVQEAADHARHRRRRQRLAHDARPLQRRDRGEVRPRALSRRRRAGARRARGHGVGRDDRGFDAARASRPGQDPHLRGGLRQAPRQARRTCRP